MALSSYDIRLYNIIVLGLAFMLIFTAFQTCGMVENVVISSATKNSNGTFTGSGYISLGIVYGVFSLSNWGAPSFVAFAGAKMSMFFSSLMYFLFILSFLKPMEWALYLGSALVGLGAAVLWTAQGNFLTINSDSQTVARNSGIFWALLQCSLLFGNIYSYFVFRGQDTITDDSRRLLFIGLSGASFLGSFALLLLRRKPYSLNSVRTLNVSQEISDDSMGSISAMQPADTPLMALKKSFHLFRTKEMMILSVVFAYTGLEMTFFSSVYGTCIGQNEHFGQQRKAYLGISGMLIGAGEIAGGVIFGLIGKKTNAFGRDPLVVIGFLTHMAAFLLAFLNLPMNCPYAESFDSTYITSNLYLTLFGSFLLGFGDSSFNTQLYSLIGDMYATESPPAFAVFKFVQSVAACAAFYYGGVIELKWQLLILVAMGTGSLLSFSSIEWKALRAKQAGYQAI
ncbi:UNC93-like protein MFSD11 isoform X2 [Pomacea canaliculata]|uniref:UNC93-like protein MFSD11 isoform X2 n=1 Tax=Pomacea canaliculata TaxID=400727 RepID=UPI000D725C0E|nr:UNC93-like protein MFSD11 isoform X2 [Pomacea canaliculata]